MVSLLKDKVLNRDGLYYEIGKFILFNTLMFIFVAILAWIDPIDSFKVYGINQQQGDVLDSALIYGDNYVSQTFSSNTEADSFQIKLSVANRSYHGTYKVELFDDSNNCIECWKKEKLDIHTAWTDFNLSESSIIPGNIYKIIVSAPEVDKVNAIVVSFESMQEENTQIKHLVYEDGEFEINGEIQDATLCFAVYRKLDNVFALFAVVILFATANLWWFNRKKNIETIAIWILIGTGTIMLLIMAPGSGPDEAYHYYSAFELSNVLMGRNNICEIEQLYSWSLQESYNSNKSFSMVYENIFKPLGTDFAKGSFEFIGWRDSLLFPASHFAPAIGITIGRFFDCNYIQVFTLARIFNMISYVFMSYLAIRLMPINKELILLLSITPMRLHQASQCSYDTLINGISMIFVIFIIKTIYEKRQFGWEHVLCCISLLGSISLVKPAYIILTFLVFSLTPDLFKSNKDRFSKMISVPLGVLIVMIIIKFSEIKLRLSGSETRYLTDRYSIAFALNSPLRYLKLVLHSIESNIWWYIQSSFGTSFGGFTISIKEYLVIVFIVLVVLCSLCQKNEKPILNRFQKIIFFFTATIGIVAIIAAFAFMWTDYGAEIINGVQGRYLIPYIAPIAICLNGEKIKANFERYILFYPVWFVEIGYIVTVMAQVAYDI